MKNMKYVVLIIFVLDMGGLNCKEVYNPTSIQNNPFILVVDGIVISGNDSTIITISRTKSLTDSAHLAKELNANVSVLGVSGVEYPFFNQGNGRYVTDHLPLDISQQYQLKIVTSDGNEFRSKPDSVHPSPAIDSVYWILDSAGAHVYVNTHDPTNNTRYYRWENVESWEYHSAFDSHLIYIDENNIVLRELANQIFRCYQTQVYPYIDVTSTSRLSSDVVYKYEVVSVPIGSEKISAVYSDLIKQYAITAEAFDFWTNLKKNTEQLGTLFDLQPFSELGNIQCVNNPDAICIGFISFSTLQKQRIFITKNQVYSWNYYPYYDRCILNSASPAIISQFFTPPGGPYGYSMVGQGLDSNHATVYLYSSNLCVDCTVHGGITTKPSYWPY
jgi:Domain of unknown function (DUF4249)